MSHTNSIKHNLYLQQVDKIYSNTKLTIYPIHYSGWHSLCRKGHPTDWDGVPAIYIGAKPEILITKIKS